jgi:hypothetical protein
MNISTYMKKSILTYFSRGKKSMNQSILKITDVYMIYLEMKDCLFLVNMEYISLWCEKLLLIFTSIENKWNM